MFTLDQAALILQNYTYYLLFPITVIEGPIITIIAGFLVSIGLMNIYATYAIVVIGDLVGDIIHYVIGRYGRDNFMNKWGKYIGITKEKIMMLESHFSEHAGKTLLTAKFFHGVGGIFLFSAGAARMPFWKFVWYNFLGAVPKSLALLALGYYFGSHLAKIDSVLDILAVVFAGAAGIGIIYYFYGRKKIP